MMGHLPCTRLAEGFARKDDPDFATHSQVQTEPCTKVALRAIRATKGGHDARRNDNILPEPRASH
jgi:hypothetical protein